ncbi:MAG: hypothetical protein HY925_02175 [Elusimicrobia bacterium]|nr:hypothetical protein [Elusimicrobiota bacterium]
MHGSIAGLPASMDLMRCPNCGHEQARGGAECGRCQVIFEKLAAKQARRDQGMGSSETPFPYSAPSIEAEAASLSASDQSALDGAAAAGYVVASFTAIAIGIEAAGWVQLGLGPWALIDVLLATGLAYGTGRGSRICSVSLFLYFILSKLAQYSQHPPSIAGIWLPFMIASAMGKGALASFNRR